MTYWQWNLYLTCGDSGIFWDTEYFIETGLLKNLWLWTPRDPCCVLNPKPMMFKSISIQACQRFLQTKKSSRAWPSACANIHDQPVFCFRRQETRLCGQFQIHFRYSMSKVRTLVPLQTDNKQTSGGIWHKITQGQRYHSTGPKVWSSLDPWESLSWKNAVDDLTDVISQGLQGHSDW